MRIKNKYFIMILILLFISIGVIIYLIFINYKSYERYKNNNKSYIRDEFYNYKLYSSYLSTDEFSKLISNNNIDYNYLIEKNKANYETLVEIEDKYILIWKDEMEYSIEKYTSILTEEDKNKFLIIQHNWEETIMSDFKFDFSLINTNSDYNVSLGSMFHYQYLSEIKDVYRERTLKIKCMHFILEVMATNGVMEEESKAIIFKY